MPLLQIIVFLLAVSIVPSFSLLLSSSCFASKTRTSFTQYYRHYLLSSYNVGSTSQMNAARTQEEEQEEEKQDDASSLQEYKNGDNGISCNNTEQTAMLPSSSRNNKIHSSTVCIVPPESNTELWKQLTKARTDLKDPGLYRWPPHVNLLYPFLDVNETILSKLRNATTKINPFYVSFNQFGCFGGKNRGVLWLYPTSRFSLQEGTAEVEEREPIKLLQQYLQDEFPHCNDQQKKGEQGYTPHMTLSHFENLAEAKKAQVQLEEWWWEGKKIHSSNDSTNSASDDIRSTTSSTAFYVEEVYLLQRSGDNGQFKIVATIPLGSSPSEGDCYFSSPRPFVHMPTVEEDWVRAERMKLKDRRNHNVKKGRGAHHRDNGRRQPRRTNVTTATPEEIAAKRSARKAKRDEINPSSKF